MQQTDVRVPSHLLTDPLQLPDQNGNQADRHGDVSRDSVAKEVAEFHRRGLSARRYRDLTSEKYLLHIDGEGDAQWASIFRGERIVIPRRHSSGVRTQENLLAPITANAIAYHVTQPFECVVEARPDREARERAQIEQVWGNGVMEEGRWNAVFAEALAMAMPYGMCPVHLWWREDAEDDLFESPGPGGTNPMALELLKQRGFIDAFCGNPWDTVFPSGAKRNSYDRMSYGLIVPTARVRQAFAHVPGAQALEGSAKMPSAATYQRIARRWLQTNLAQHGTGVLYQGEGGEELSALIYQETAPGVDPEYPTGRLVIIALKGAASTDQEDRAGSAANALLLHDDALPGRNFSAGLVYSSERFGDVLGHPWVANLDDLQVQLNQLLSARRDYIRRSVRAPLVKSGVIHDDTTVLENDAEMEVDPMVPFQPFYLELPKGHVQTLNTDIAETRDSMFRIGGWMASSRGESKAGDPAAKVVALAKQDDNVHGPTHQRFRETVEDRLQHAWRLMKEYGDVPWLVSATGDELAHVADLWVDREALGERPPRYKLVQGYGATPEARGQQLLNMFGMRDAQGREVLDTPMLRKLWPDNTLFVDTDYPEQVRKRRPRQINAAIQKAVQDFREQTGFDVDKYADPWVQQAAQVVHQQVWLAYEILMDDDVEAHLDSLSLLTQDETEDAVVRHVARGRQDLYFQWMAARQAAQAGMAAPSGPPQAPGAVGAQGRDVLQSAQPGGTVTSDAIRQAPAEVNQLTQQARQTGA